MCGAESCAGARRRSAARASASPLSRSASGGHGDVDVLALDVSDAWLAAADDLHDVVGAGVGLALLHALLERHMDGGANVHLGDAHADRLLDLVDRDPRAAV